MDNKKTKYLFLLKRIDTLLIAIAAITPIIIFTYNHYFSETVYYELTYDYLGVTPRKNFFQNPQIEVCANDIKTLLTISLSRKGLPISQIRDFKIVSKSGYIVAAYFDEEGAGNNIQYPSLRSVVLPDFRLKTNTKRRILLVIDGPSVSIDFPNHETAESGQRQISIAFTLYVGILAVLLMYSGRKFVRNLANDLKFIKIYISHSEDYKFMKSAYYSYSNSRDKYEGKYRKSNRFPGDDILSSIIRESEEEDDED